MNLARRGTTSGKKRRRSCGETRRGRAEIASSRGARAAAREPKRRQRQRMSLEAVKRSLPPPRTSQTAVDEDRRRAEADAE
ncbi:hypothetical protein NL676_023571 [Syzygium grande]|nr:hypothetical protein NL676_023571 [Syzygium grande]